MTGDINAAVLEAALQWASIGASPLPIKADKTRKPNLASWKPLQEESATEDKIRSWYNGKPLGVGVVFGVGGYECLDIENADIAATYSQLAKESGLRKLWRRVQNGYTESAPSGGYHVIWRCSDPDAVEGNTKLASDESGTTLIETRGVGGYAVVAPSPAACGKTEIPYALVAGNPGSVAEITPEERAELLGLARALDQRPPKPVPERRPKSGDGDRPGDTFNEHATWRAILEPLDWVELYKADGLTYWRRPGKDFGGPSATSGVRGEGGDDLLWVFSTNAEPLEANKSYTKFGAYTLLHHEGDWAEATKQLAQDLKDEAAKSNPYSLLGQILTRSELAALPKPEPLIDGWLDLRTTVVVVGDTGSNKTFTTLGWACSVATGEPWLGHAVCTKPLPVIYVVGEGASGLDARLAAWEAENTEVPDARLTIVKQPASIDNEEFWAQLQTLASVKQARLVIFDTFSSLAPEADETKDAAKVVRRMGELASRIDGTTVLVHHTGWGEKERARGGSQLEANPDSVIVLKKEDADPSVVSIRRKKVKDGPSGDTIWVVRVEVGESCVLEAVLEPTREEGPKQGKNLSNAALRDAILQWIATNPPTTQKQIRTIACGLFGVGTTRVDSAFEVLKQEKSIVSAKAKVTEQRGDKEVPVTRDVWSIASGKADYLKISDEPAPGTGPEA